MGFWSLEYQLLFFCDLLLQHNMKNGRAVQLEWRRDGCGGDAYDDDDGHDEIYRRKPKI